MDVLELAARPASRRILAALTDEWMELGHLADALDVARPSLTRALRPLVDAGLVDVRERRGERGRWKEARAVPFSLHWERRGPVHVSWASTGELDEEEALLYQIPPGGFREDVRTALRAIRPIARDGFPRFVVLFGSVATGQGRAKSDVDLLFLLDRDAPPERERLQDALADAAGDLQHPVHPAFATVEALLRDESPTLSDVRKNGIIVYGSLGAGLNVWSALSRYRSTSG